MSDIRSIPGRWSKKVTESTSGLFSLGKFSGFLASEDYSAVPLQDPGDDWNNSDEVDRGDSDECRKFVGDVFVNGQTFQSLIAVLILANAVCIGLETDMTEMNWLWNIFEDIFLAVFVVEIVLRLFYLREVFWNGKDWVSNIFDATLVLTGLVDFFVTKVLQGTLGQLGFFMKACRLLRILRLFRLFKMIKPLYMLASGFLESSVAVFWVTVLCGLGMYICAIFLTRTLGHMDTETDSHQMYAYKFGSVGHSMFTLFELMSNPDLESMEELMLASPGMMVFFVVFIIFGSFAMLSILTGVISEGMIEKGNLHKEEMRFDEERKKKKFMQKMKEHFDSSDIDADGEMSRAEFDARLPEMIQLFRDHDIYYSEDDLTTVFELVDFDQDGTVATGEFLDGMASFTANASDLPVQFLRLQSRIVSNLNRMQSVFLAKLDQVEDNQKSLDAKMNALALKFGGGEPPSTFPRFGICC